MGWEHHLKQILIAIDQLGNALILGWADETISARAWRRSRGSVKWSSIRWVIDRMFWWEPDHCQHSYHAEKLRRHTAAEYRANNCDHY